MNTREKKSLIFLSVLCFFLLLNWGDVVMLSCYHIYICTLYLYVLYISIYICTFWGAFPWTRFKNITTLLLEIRPSDLVWIFGRFTLPETAANSPVEVLGWSIWSFIPLFTGFLLLYIPNGWDLGISGCHQQYPLKIDDKGRRSPKAFWGLRSIFKGEILVLRSVHSLGFQTPAEEVFGPQKPTQMTFSAAIWKTRDWVYMCLCQRYPEFHARCTDWGISCTKVLKISGLA